MPATSPTAAVSQPVTTAQPAAVDAVAPLRVVTLIASATEIVCALGCEDWIVGRSHECDFPKSIARLPACSSPRIDVSGSSLEIDNRVKEALTTATAIYEVDGDLINRLAPDVIITQTQCEVCAVSLKDVERACTRFESQPKIVPLGTNGLADLWRDIGYVADALHVPQRGRQLIAALQGRLRAVAERARELPKVRVACIEWIEPLMAGGNWVPELVDIAGGIELFGKAGEHSPWMTWDALRAADPDVLVVLPCGWDIPKAISEMTPLTSQPGWSQLSAVRGGQIYITDGNQYFNRPGPRLVDSAEILAEILHPEIFSFGHEGAAWVRYV